MLWKQYQVPWTVYFDKAVLNPEMEDGWYEREYRVIAKSKDTAAYSGAHKWWSPDFNSTCIKIEKDDQALFESEILQPYFDMTLNKLFGDTDPDMKYWWLTANPKIWSFADLKVGEDRIIRCTTKMVIKDAFSKISLTQRSVISSLVMNQIL